MTALTPVGDNRFTADLSPRWTIVGKPNGGYLLALLGRAVATEDHPHVLAASAHYLHSPDPGPVEVTAVALRRGRSASQFRAQLAQDGRPCVEALFTVGRLTEDSTPAWDRGAPRPRIAPWEECVRVPPLTPLGAPAALMGEVDLRLDPHTGGFDTPPSGRGELLGRLALPGSEAFDPFSLLYAVDSFPPATLDIAPSGWVPTLEMTVYVRALPVEGPVAVQQTARLIEADRVDESCWVWDAEGRLVAQATQLAGIRFR